MTTFISKQTHYQWHHRPHFSMQRLASLFFRRLVAKVTFEAASTRAVSMVSILYALWLICFSLCAIYSPTQLKKQLRWVVRYAGCSSPITFRRETRWSCGVMLSAAVNVGISESALGTFWRVGRSASAAVMPVGALCHIAVSYVQISA